MVNAGAALADGVAEVERVIGAEARVRRGYDRDLEPLALDGVVV